MDSSSGPDARALGPEPPSRHDLPLLWDFAGDVLEPTMAIARLAETASLEPGVPEVVRQRLQAIAGEARVAQGICLELLEEQR